MKDTFKINLCLALCILLISCVPVSAPVTPTLHLTSTAIPNLSITPTSTFKPTSIPQPTLIPTIESVEVAEKLKNIAIEYPSTFNEHTLRKITGWSNGFNSGLWNNDYAGYQWMDNDHLLLFPAVGEHQHPNWTTIDTRATVINIDSGKIWLPPLDQPKEGNRMLRVLLPRWSPTLGILITSEKTGEDDAIREGVTTYKSDGTFVAHYEGGLVDVSPTGTKVLITDDTWIDLSNGKTVVFSWERGVPTERWLPIWSPDETQVYVCCYFYGNAKIGESYTISDENTIFDGHLDDNIQSFHHSYGMWLNDKFVLAQFDGFYTYRDGFFPVFDISARTFRNLGVIANLPDEFNYMPYTRLSISPNRDYMWISRGAQSPTDPQVYLVELKSLESQLYRSYSASWSANGDYAILDSQVLTLANKELRSIPPYPEYRYILDNAWHPTKGVLASIRVSEDKQTQTLFMLNVENLELTQVALPPIFSSDFYRSMIFWSPKGEHIALLAADNSLWQIDYPELKNLEQLTPPMSDSKDVMWSSDGEHLSFISGADIYIVDTTNAP